LYCEDFNGEGKGVPVHDMKAYSGSRRGIALLIHNLGARW